MNTLYDPVRKKYVACTPEEEIRQNLIRKMVGLLGYPRGLISVEKEIAALLSIPFEIDSERRIDILCQCLGKEGVQPLLLVECKVQTKDRASALKQVFGYNERIKAPFVALANGERIEVFWREKQKVASVPFLPPFQELVNQLCFL